MSVTVYVTRDNRDKTGVTFAVCRGCPTRPDPTRPISSYQGSSFQVNHPSPIRHLGDGPSPERWGWEC